MKFYKITDKRLGIYNEAIGLHHEMETTWDGYIERLTTIKNDRGIRLVPAYTDFILGDQGAIYMLPKIVAFKFRYQLQLKAIRDKVWVQTPVKGMYLLNPKGGQILDCRRVNSILSRATLTPTIYDIYKRLFKLDPVPFGAKDGPAEINQAVEEKVKELCQQGTDPVVLLVPRFFVTEDNIPVVGLPEQMPYVPEIKKTIDKGWLQAIDEEELKQLSSRRHAIIKEKAHD